MLAFMPAPTGTIINLTTLLAMFDTNVQNYIMFDTNCIKCYRMVVLEIFWLGLLAGAAHTTQFSLEDSSWP